MTLVIAGFDKDKIFFIADSGIQRSIERHIRSFKKIYELPIMVYQPHFMRTFRRYLLFKECHDNLVFAIAGSTLVAQDIMNVIINHLRYTRVDSTDDTLKSFYLTTHCNPKLHCANSKIEYDRDFEYISYSDIMKVINRNNLKEIIKISVEHAIDSLRDCSEDDFLNNNEYLFALYCNETKRNYLYKIKINVKKYFDNDNKMIKKKEISIDEINKDELAIIGITRYNSELQHIYSKLLKIDIQDLFQKVLKEFMKDHSELLDSKNLVEINVNEIVKVFIGECLNDVQFPYSEELNEFKESYFELLKKDVFERLLGDFLRETVKKRLEIYSFCISEDDEIKGFVDEFLDSNIPTISDILLNKFHEIVKNHPEIVLEDAENNNKNANIYEILHPIVYKRFDKGQIIEKIVVDKDGEKTKMMNSMLKYYSL